MEEGILVKAYNFLLKKEASPTDTNWGVSFLSLFPPTNEGQLSWDDRAGLLKLYFGTTANCIDIISQAVSSAGVQLFRSGNGGKSKIRKDYREWLDTNDYIRRRVKSVEITPVETHPVLDLLSYVNGKLNQQNLYDILTQHLELSGNAYWHITYSAQNIPALIRFIPPDKIIDIEEDATGTPIKYWYYNKQGLKEYYEAKNIIHFWYPGPYSTTFGCGKAYKISGWSNTEKNLITYLNSNFKNMAVPPAMVVSKNKLPDTQYQALKKQFEDMYVGVQKSGKVAFSSGEIEIIKLGYTPDEMGVDITTRLCREMIANGFGVPISKLTDATNRAVADRQDIQFLRDEITPKITSIAQELTESLLPMYGDSGQMFFAAPDIVPDDVTAKMNERKANLESGVTTRNEERANMDMEPNSDPNADMLLVPSTLTPIRLLGTQPSQPQLARQILDGINAKIKDIQKETK